MEGELSICISSYLSSRRAETRETLLSLSLSLDIYLVFTDICRTRFSPSTSVVRSRHVGLCLNPKLTFGCIGNFSLPLGISTYVYVCYIATGQKQVCLHAREKLSTSPPRVCVSAACMHANKDIKPYIHLSIYPERERGMFLHARIHTSVSTSPLRVSPSSRSSFSQHRHTSHISIYQQIGVLLRVQTHVYVKKQKRTSLFATGGSLRTFRTPVSHPSAYLQSLYLSPVVLCLFSFSFFSTAWCEQKKIQEYVIRSLYVELLGHDASFAHFHAVKLTNESHNLKAKRLGKTEINRD